MRVGCSSRMRSSVLVDWRRWDLDEAVLRRRREPGRPRLEASTSPNEGRLRRSVVGDDGPAWSSGVSLARSFVRVVVVAAHDGGDLGAVDGVVVETLRDEDGIGEAEVDRQRRDGWHQARPQRTGEVGDVAHEPNEQEG